MHVSREGRGKAKKGYKTEMGRRVCERLGINEGWAWLGELKREAGVGVQEREIGDCWKFVESDARAPGLQGYGATGATGLRG